MAARLSTRKLRERSEAKTGTSKRSKQAAEKPAEPEPYITGSNAPSTDLNLKASIGRRVRMLRQRLELTATDLAGQAGLSPGMLSKIENGGISPSLSTLRTLTEALPVPMTIFVAD